MVLQNIATMSIQRKVSLLASRGEGGGVNRGWLHCDAAFQITQGMFEPYMKSFYVRSTDPTHIKTLKVGTLLSITAAKCDLTILRFQSLVCSSIAFY